MENTLDLWEIPPASATRMGHPAPFPIELPGRLIELYTYRGDLVLDPFAGSGTTAVAALRLDDISSPMTWTPRHRAGPRRADALWKAIAKAGVLREGGNAPLVLLMTAAPARGSAGAEALRHMTGQGKPIRAVIEMLEHSGLGHLSDLSQGKLDG